VQFLRSLSARIGSLGLTRRKVQAILCKFRLLARDIALGYGIVF
jgi:hypothetical protein